MLRNNPSSISIVLIALCAIGLVFTQATAITSDKQCLNRPRPAGYYARNNITIAANAWTSSILGAQIANILLNEVIGIQNQISVVDQLETWDQISKGQMHMLLEYWPTDRAAEEKKFIYTDMTITFAGPVGMVGQIGWYVPRYVLNDVPSALFGDFSNPTVSAYFNHTLILGAEDWLGVEQKIITEQNFSLSIEYLTDEADLTAKIEDRFSKKEQMLFYFWKPHTLSSVFDMMRVQLPNDSIYYPPQILGKMMWSKLPQYSPEAAYLAQSFSLSDNQMTELLNFLYKNGSMWDTACNWIQQNEQVWENWIRPTSYKEVGMGLQIAMWVLSGLCVACTIFYLIVTLKYRKSKVIIASSGVFLISMCIGGMLMFGSVIAFISNTMIGCNLFIWMLPVGFALLFGSLFAKTGRIYLLFSNKSLQLVKYTDRDVGFGVGVILLGECVILAVMTGLQPASFEFQNEGDSQFSFCLFHFPTGITLLVYNGIVMVFGMIISALVSRLRLTLYNEAKYIGWAMYNFGFVIIFIAVIFLVTDVIVRFALLCCCILFLTMISLSVLFIPKIKLLFNYTEEELRQMNEAQLQAVIRSYTKKFASSSDRKKSTNKGTTTGSFNGSAGKSGSYNKGSIPISTGGSSFEDEMANLATNVKAMSDQIKELRSENKRLKETTSDDYRSLYEKFYHENMILKNEVFELKGKLKTYEQNKED